MADIYDFATGRLCKKCNICGYYKDLLDFERNPLGKYQVSDMCRACMDKILANQRIEDNTPQEVA